MEDGESAAGMINAVTRLGDTIRRPTGRWTPAVHSLLRYIEKTELEKTGLEKTGLAEIPRVLGVDGQGREMLTYLPGEVANRPWPAVLRTESGLAQVGAFLKRYRAAVADYVPPEDSEWYVPGLRWQPGQTLCHGDMAPWNTLWRDGKFTGLIDWDFAAPGEPLDDIAQFAWHGIPLRGSLWRQAGFDAEPDLRARLEALCAAYGAEPVEVIAALSRLQVQQIRRISRFGESGMAPWAFFKEQGFAAEIQEENGWLQRNRSRILG